MRVASVCSSVGGLDLGLHRAGHETVSFCEVDPWRRTVLARHWPGVPTHPDLKELRASDIPPCALFVGGTPCQDLSNAGRRAGLDGERSGLFHAYAQLRLDLYDLHGCAWSLWENVAGALSSNDGRDFATVLASHVGADVPVPAAGWGGSGVVAGPWGTAEWRLLDAQFFGVPQRRRRVFVVGHLGAVDPVEVLADTPRGDWDSAPGGEARPHLAAGPPRGTRGPGRVSHTLTSEGFDASEDGTGRGTPLVAGTLKANAGKGGSGIGPETNFVVAGGLTTGGPAQLDDNAVGGNHIVAFSENQRGEVVESPVAQALGTGGGKPGQGYAAARTAQGVRRLTPTECERLMGWPDGWTLDNGPSLVDAPQAWPGGPMPNDPAPDGRRYSACGDGVVAHVAEWIGLGFAAVEDRQEVAA